MYREELKASGDTEGYEGVVSDEGRTFEQNLEELEQVVSRLERGDLPLDEAIALYRRGLSLTKQCSERLNAAETEIKKLVAEQGQFRLAEFESPDASDD